MNQLAYDVYETLTGQTVNGAGVPGVDNAFEPGMPCDRQYEEVYEACQRLLARLNKEDSDPDLDIILDHLQSIQKELCLKMFAYGAQFSAKP